MSARPAAPLRDGVRTPSARRASAAAVIAAVLLVLSLGLPLAGLEGLGGFHVEVSPGIPTCTRSGPTPENGRTTIIVCTPDSGIDLVDNTAADSAGLHAPLRVFVVGALVLTAVGGRSRTRRPFTAAALCTIAGVLISGLAPGGSQIAAVAAAVVLFYAGHLRRHVSS